MHLIGCLGGEQRLLRPGDDPRGVVAVEQGGVDAEDAPAAAQVVLDVRVDEQPAGVRLDRRGADLDLVRRRAQQRQHVRVEARVPVLPVVRRPQVGLALEQRQRDLRRRQVCVHREHRRQPAVEAPREERHGFRVEGGDRVLLLDGLKVARERDSHLDRRRREGVGRERRVEDVVLVVEVRDARVLAAEGLPGVLGHDELTAIEEVHAVLARRVADGREAEAEAAVRLFGRLAAVDHVDGAVLGDHAAVEAAAALPDLFVARPQEGVLGAALEGQHARTAACSSSSRNADNP